ncbi:MAG: helix-turn-helix domain-containing protein [Blastochloris sp.]|nr:helix-turn-helix domain-containing protein [Blastochloris sp.]
MTAHTIPILEKSISVLEYLAAGRRATAGQIGRELGLAASSSYRILQTYAAAGWLARDEQGRHHLGRRLLEIGQQADPYEILRQNYRGVLRELRDRTGLTVKLSLRVGDEFLMLLREESPEALCVTARVGARESLCCGSAGALLLSRLGEAEVKDLMEKAPKHVWQFQSRDQLLDRIKQGRRSGSCVDAGETHPQLHTLSFMPRGDEVVLTLIGWQTDFTASKRKDYLSIFKECLEKKRTSR